MRTAFPTLKSIEFSSSIFFRELEIEHSQICHRSVRAVTDPSGLRYVVPSMNDIDTLPEVSSANDRPARPNVGNGSAAGDAESVHQPHVDIARRVAPEMSAFPSPLKCGANESHIITAARYQDAAVLQQGGGVPYSRRRHPAGWDKGLGVQVRYSQCQQN